MVFISRERGEIILNLNEMKSIYERNTNQSRSIVRFFKAEIGILVICLRKEIFYLFVGKSKTRRLERSVEY